MLVKRWDSLTVTAGRTPMCHFSANAEDALANSICLPRNLGNVERALAENRSVSAEMAHCRATPHSRDSRR
jgi:hypothetical protein